MLVRFIAALALAAVAQGQASPLGTFRNHNRTFQIDLPAGWRMAAPNEAVRIREHANVPLELRVSEPRLMYPVGPVESWLEGDFSSPCMIVVERRDRWYIEHDYEQVLRSHWAAHAEHNGVEHELSDVRLEKIGTQQVECVVAVRTTKQPQQATAMRFLEAHCPTAKQQLTIAFGCPPAEFPRWQPEFRRWLATLTFARTAEEQPKLADRLWTPIIAGAVVGLVLLALYRRSRGRR